MVHIFFFYNQVSIGFWLIAFSFYMVPRRILKRRRNYCGYYVNHISTCWFLDIIALKAYGDQRSSRRIRFHRRLHTKDNYSYLFYAPSNRNIINQINSFPIFPSELRTCLKHIKQLIFSQNQNMWSFFCYKILPQMYKLQKK